jgi:hypothetical protein
MKTLGIITITVALTLLFSGVSIADDWKNESGKGAPGRSQYNHGDRGYKKRSDNHDRNDYRGHPDYHENRGYRERPYDRGRHYGHYKYKDNRYAYQGHWRSWEEWDRYRRKHTDVYKHGHYYREKAHLMFRFCDPAGNCFFFSIGR